VVPSRFLEHHHDGRYLKFESIKRGKGCDVKWFKHFTDSNRSQEMLRIKRQLGMAGIGCFWNLVESCAGLMEKSRDEKYSEAHCRFSFDVGYLANIFGCKAVRVPVILQTFQECSQLQFKTDGFVVEVEMPKLLEWLDRDTDRARPKRGQAELRDRVDSDKEIDKEQLQKNPISFYCQEADIFLEGVRKFGPGDSALEEFLGEHRWSIWKKIGGSTIRNMPSGEKGRLSLAYKIKDNS